MLFNIFPLWHQSTQTIYYILPSNLKLVSCHAPVRNSILNREKFVLNSQRTSCPVRIFSFRPADKKSIIRVFRFCTRQLLDSSLVYLTMILGRCRVSVYHCNKYGDAAGLFCTIGISIGMLQDHCVPL